MMMMRKAGLTRREKEGVHLRKRKKEKERIKKENNDDDDVGLSSISETATIKDSLFIEAVHHQHQHLILNQSDQHSRLNCFPSVTSHQPKVICSSCNGKKEKIERKRERKQEDKEREEQFSNRRRKKDQQPVNPFGDSFSGHVDGSSGYHRCFSCSLTPLTNTFSSQVNCYSNQGSKLSVQLCPSTKIKKNSFQTDKIFSSSGQKQQQQQKKTPSSTKRNCDQCILKPSSACLPSNLSTFSSPSCGNCDSINCNNQNKVKIVNKLTDHSTTTVKCVSPSSPIGSNGNGLVCFSGLVANRRKLFSSQLLGFTIKSVNSTNQIITNQSNYNCKLKRQPTKFTQFVSSSLTTPKPFSSTTTLIQEPLESNQQFSSSSSILSSRINPVKSNNPTKKYQHPHSPGQCYKSFKMVADTDNHTINGEGMAMTINHPNREMSMFIDNMNGHHYENINVYNSNQHHHHHHPVSNGKSVNSYLKDRPNSANSYSLESNSSGSNTTDSSTGNISSPLSGLNGRGDGGGCGGVGGGDDTHGDELQYGPGIVDKLRSKFLQYSLQTSNRTNGYNRSIVKRCSSLENLADRDSPSSSPLFHHSTCNGANFGLRKGPNYVKYHQHNHLTNNNNNNNNNNTNQNNINHQHHYSLSQSNHTKGNNHNGVDSGIDINGCGGGASAAGGLINKGSINGKTFQSSSSTPTPTITSSSSSSPEKRLQGENRNSCSRTTNGFTSSSSSSSTSSGRNYRKYEQQPIKSNHYHHLNQHSSIYHNHNHRYNCDGLLKRAQSVETLLLESRNSTKSTITSTSTSTSSTFTDCNNINNNSTVNSTSIVGANCYNFNLNSTRLTSTTNLNSNLNSIPSPFNTNSENCEPLPLSSTNQQQQQQSRWQSTTTTNNNNPTSVNSPPPPTLQTTTTTTNNKVNSVSQVCNHLVTKQQDFVDSIVTTTTTSKKMSSEDNNIVGVDSLSESKLKSSTSSIYSPSNNNNNNSTLTSDKKMIVDVTPAPTTTSTINNNNNNNCDLVNYGSRKLVKDELPKPDTVKNCKKIFETNSVSPTPLTGPLSPSSVSSSSSSSTLSNNQTNVTTINESNVNNNHSNCSPNESDHCRNNNNNGGQGYRKGGIYGSSASAIRRKPPVLSSIEKKITVNKVTINNNHNTAVNNNNNNHNQNGSRLINGSGTSSSPTSPALPPKPPFLITKKSPLNGELNHVHVNNNNYLSAIKPIGKLSPNESTKNQINSGKSSTINGSKDRLTGNNLVTINKSKSLLPSSSSSSPPSSQSTSKPKLINVKSDESSPSSSRSSSSSSSPILSPSSSFIPPSPLNGSKKSVIGDDLIKTVEGDDLIKTVEGEDTIDGGSTIQQQLTTQRTTINGQFSPSLDKQSDKSLVTKVNNFDQRPTTTTTTSSMINNKPIANIKPIQLELNEDQRRWKSSSTIKSDSKSTEKVFPSLGVTTTSTNTTTTTSNNHNLITKDQSYNESNCLNSEIKSIPSPTSESNNHHNSDRNKINYVNINNNNNNNKSTINKKIEVDEKPSNSPSMINKDNQINGSRSYSSSCSTSTTSSLTSTIIAKSSPSSGTSMIFDFRGKNVKANVAVHSPPFSVVRPPSSNSSSIGGRNDDNEDDYNYTGSTELPKPSGIIFKGENIIIAGGSLLIKRNKKLTISFDDKATSTFEYPSEISFIEDSMTSNFGSTSSQQLTNSDESSSVIQQPQQSTTGSSLKNNTTLGGAFSGGLASYKPTFLASESASFQLGVSRVIKAESDNNIKSSSVNLIDNHHDDESNQLAGQHDDTSFNMIKPAEPSETASWSTSSTALDLLF